MESNKKNGKLEQEITSAPSLGCHKMEVMPNKDFEYVGALFLVFLEIFECGCFDGWTCLEINLPDSLKGPPLQTEFTFIPTFIYLKMFQNIWNQPYCPSTMNDIDTA